LLPRNDATGDEAGDLLEFDVPARGGWREDVLLVCRGGVGIQAGNDFPGREADLPNNPGRRRPVNVDIPNSRKNAHRGPGGPPFSSSVITTTRPSAGETTASGSGGMARSGSRKKEKTKVASPIRIAAAIHQ